MKQRLVIIILSCVAIPIYGQQKIQLDFQQFIDMVLQHSKEITISNNDVKLALVEKQKAMSQWLPQAGAEAGYKRFLSPEYIFMEFPDFKQFEIDPETGDVYLPESWQKFKASLNNTFSAGVVIDQTLFSLKALYDVATAKSYQQLVDEKKQLILQEVLLESSKAFLGTQLLHKTYLLDKNSLADAKENLIDIEAKYKNGLVSRFDYLQANINYKTAEKNAYKSARLHDEAINSIKLLCNIGLQDSLKLEPFEESILSNLTNLYNTQPENNLNYKLSLAHINILSKELKSKRAAYYPTLKGQLGYTYYAINDDFRLNGNLNSFSHASFTLSIPILSGGYNRALVKESKIKLRNAQIKHEFNAKEINKDISNCIKENIETQLNIETAAETEIMAKEAYELAKSNSKNGLISQRELQEAKLLYEKCSIALSEAKYENRCNILYYYKLNGTLIQKLKNQQ